MLGITSIMKKIIDILKIKTPTFSFEFFPPKTEDGEKKLEISIEKLKQLQPDFVSITYGAGGSTRVKTNEWVSKIQNQFDLISMAHLTCVGSTKEELREIIINHKNQNIKNIMALRGDPPKDSTTFVTVNGGFSYAYQLIEFIKKEFGDTFSIGAACYPEKHVEAKTLEEDIDYLKQKVDSGVDFLITQLFFDNDKFYHFRDLAYKKGIKVPIIAGIMPITAYKQIERFTKMANCSIPEVLLNSLNELQNNEEELIKKSIEFSIQQCEDLLKNEASGIHFYTLNQSDATFQILKKIYEIFKIPITL